MMKDDGKDSIVKFTWKNTMTVAVMLFGLYFGAGNLIFPVYMGQQAGRNVWSAVFGFLVTGVGIPLLAIAALGNSRSNGLQQLASRVSKKYGLFFTAALYLTIGPFFAIPRCASTSFSVGILPIIENENLIQPLQWGFSFVFFAVALWFSLRPGKILTYIGKVLTPAFLVFLSVLLITALLFPMGDYTEIIPNEAYSNASFFKGFLEGYNTMDALAGLAFGIVVVNAIHSLGVKDPSATAFCTIRSGIFSSILMCIIYIMLALVGAQSRIVYPISSDSGEALYIIASHYFHQGGAIILAVIVTLACLKTAVGLFISCGETFVAMSHEKIKYNVWVVAFCVISFLIANLGLNTIIAYSIPVLMLLYPLAMALIFLALSGNLFQNDQRVYVTSITLTFIAGIFDLLNALADGLKNTTMIQWLLSIGKHLPFFDLGLGWVIPACIGFVIGMVIHCIYPRACTEQK